MAVTVYEPGNHQVWHQSDRATGALPTSTWSCQSRASAWRSGSRKRWSNWARMMDAEGWVPTTKPHLNPGVFFVPDEPDALDRRRFYLAARFKRERPEYVPLDLIAELQQMGQVDIEAQMKEFFEQMAGFRSDVADPRSSTRRPGTTPPCVRVTARVAGNLLQRSPLTPEGCTMTVPISGHTGLTASIGTTIPTRLRPGPRYRWRRPTGASPAARWAKRWPRSRKSASGSLTSCRSASTEPPTLSPRNP